MEVDCPFCAQPNAPQAMICRSCSRDIGIPKTLIAERDGLVRKRDAMRDELATVKTELERLKRRLRNPLTRR